MTGALYSNILDSDELVDDPPAVIYGQTRTPSAFPLPLIPPYVDGGNATEEQINPSPASRRQSDMQHGEMIAPSRVFQPPLELGNPPASSERELRPGEGGERVPKVPAEAFEGLHKLKIARTVAEHKARDPEGYKALIDRILRESSVDLPPPTAETCCEGDYRGRRRNRLGIPHVPGCPFDRRER